MIVLTVCYESGIALDTNYYTGTHMPLVEKLRSYGLRQSEVRKILGTPMGTAARYQLMTSLYFDDATALQTAMGSAEGRMLAADVGMGNSSRLWWTSHMNETIGLADAKARLSELIDRVEAGETVIIARNGLPVAQVRPLRRLSPEDAVKKIRAIAKRVSRRNQGKSSWPEPGRTLRDVAHERHRF